MRPPVSLFLAGTFVALFSLLGTRDKLLAANADPKVQKIFDNLLAAIKANDRDLFVADATETVKKALTQQVLDGLNKELGARLKAGYASTYLCELNQSGHQVYLWKLTFKDSGDDVVTRVALKDGKVGGFFLQ